MDPTGPYAAVVGKFLERRRQGKPLPITGDGTQTRDFVHVRDVVQANLLAGVAAAANGSIYNVGTGVGTSIAEVAALIGGPVEYLPERFEMRHAVADVSRARRDLGYAPTVPLEDGIAALLSHSS